MVATLDKDGGEDPPKRAQRKDFLNNLLADFVTKGTVASSKNLKCIKSF